MRLAPIVQSLTEPLLSPLVSAITGASGSGFSPTSLFVSGQQGYVYDLDDQFAEKTAYRRNLLTWSEQFDNVSWAKTEATVTANVAVAPDGTLTADKFIPSTNALAHYLARTGVSDGNKTFSVYAKKDGYDYLVLLTPVGNVSYNLATGAVANAGVIPATIQSIGNGWYRCSMTITLLSAATIYISGGSSSAASFFATAGDGASGILIWGAQLEAGSAATEYQRVTDWNTELLAAFPNTTVYLDSAGTTAASVNGLVGLVLDKSKATPVGRRNLIPYSEQFDTSWTRLNLNATGTPAWTNVAVAPDGTTTADKLIATTTSGEHRVQLLTGIASGVTPVTFSFYAKAAEYTHIATYTADGNVGRAFDLANGTLLGTIGGVAPTNSSITAVGDGWYRCMVSWTPTTGTGVFPRIYVMSDATTTVFAGNDTNGALVWGAQFEIGSSVSSYQKVIQPEGGWMLGNHRYQTTTGNKPILRGSPAGGNLVTNGDFASGTGWIPNTWVISGGSATATNVSDSLAQNYTFTAGNVYRVTFTVTAFSGTGGVRPRFFGGTTVTGSTRSATGTYVEYMTAAAGNNQFALASTTTTATITVDNIEVVDVSAGSVVAPYSLQYDGVDDFMQTASVDFATVTSDGLARRNLLTFPSAFDNAAWVKFYSTISANAFIAPDGTLTADKIVENTDTNIHATSQSVTTVALTSYTSSVYVKAAGRNFAQIRYENGGSTQLYAVNINLVTGAYNTTSFGGPVGTSAAVTDAGDGWWRVSITVTSNNTSFVTVVYAQNTLGNNSYAGDGSSGILVWGAQVEASSTASTFQNIGTDKMTVCHGVRKLSDATVGLLVELSANVTSNAGSFAIFAPLSTGLQNFNFQSSGTALASASKNSIPAPALRLLTCSGNISGDLASITVSGETIAQATADQGTGNYGNYVLYFGRRAGTSNPFNGLEYSSICVGKTASASELASIERWVNQRTRAY